MSGSSKSPDTHYKLAFARMIFVVVLAAVLAGPQLSSPEAGPGFAAVRSVLLRTPFEVWIAIGVIAGLALLLLRAAQTLRFPAVNANASHTETPPIESVVQPAKGGTELASASYPIELKFLGCVGWLIIPDNKKEHIVVDNSTVVRKTRLFFTPLRLLGKPVYARRVLLRPMTKVDISADARTSDGWKLEIKASIDVEVIDPVYAATMSSPMVTLRESIIGAIGGLIPQRRLDDTVFYSEGELQRLLGERFKTAPALAGHFRVDVLKAEPTGDDTLIKKMNQIEEERKNKELAGVRGETERERAKTTLAIEAAKQEQEIEFKRKTAQLEMQIKMLEQDAETDRELIRAVAAIVQVSGDPARAIREIAGVIMESRYQRDAATVSVARPAQNAITESATLLEKERISLERGQRALGCTEFTLMPLPDAPDRPGTARITHPDFTLSIVCPPSYPQERPTVELVKASGEPVPLKFAWSEDSHLADVVAAARMTVF